jgi:hypothetical protein
MTNITEEDIFEIVYKTEGKSRNKMSKVILETATRGLLYRTNVYLDGFLVDAKEMSCLDLATLENGPSVFKSRYMATHQAFEQQYFVEKIFIPVLDDMGDYKHGTATCEVNTYTFENIIKTEVLVEGSIVDELETEVIKQVADDKKAFKIQYIKQHDEFIRLNIVIPKFPVNTFLNSTLKKFYFYDKNPMHAFYLFLFTVFFVLWILAQIMCGKSLPKLAKSIGGKEANLIVRDLQKTVCIRTNYSKKDRTEETKELLHDKLYKDGYLVIPQTLTFETLNERKIFYIKNSIDGDIIVKINNQIIENLESPLVTAEMLIKIISPKSQIIKPEGIATFEFKIESSFLKSTSIKEGEYKGRLILEIIKVKYNKIEVASVDFTFNVRKDNNKLIEKEK